jgi:IclR family acetate operon transcriptional repressor
MNSIEKTLAVLRALSSPDRPRRLADIAERTGLNKTTAHRILQILIAEGYATTRGDGAYASGPALLALAGSALAEHDLGVVAHPVLDHLRRQTGHAVHLAVRSGTAAMSLARAEGRRPYARAGEPGMQVALHCSAIGKALLAELPEEEMRAVIAATSPLVRHTAATIIEPDRLIEELAAVRERGFAIDDEETKHDVRCVGAVVRDRHGTPIGAVAVSAPTATLDGEETGVLVMAAAGRISTALGLPGRGA